MELLWRPSDRDERGDERERERDRERELKGGHGGRERAQREAAERQTGCDGPYCSEPHHTTSTRTGRRTGLLAISYRRSCGGGDMATRKCLLSLLLPLLATLQIHGATGACKDHSGRQACSQCAGAKGSLGGHCGWCPIDDKCAQCVGEECKIQTKCSGKQMVTASKQCPTAAQNWTPPVSKLIPSCDFERITCAHGTTMNNSYCQNIMMTSWPACPGHKCIVNNKGDSSRFPSCYLSEDHHLARCKCPMWLNGTDCALVVGPAALPGAHRGQDMCTTKLAEANAKGRHVWDGSFINMKLDSPKHMECFLDPSKTPFTLTDHRVNITVTPAKSGNHEQRDLTFVISMRRRGDHPDAQTPADVAAMSKCEFSPINYNQNLKPKTPGVSTCLFARQPDIACTVFNCKPTYVRSQTDDSKWDAQYDCESAHCTPWAGLEVAAKALLSEISTQKGGLRFAFKSVDESRGKAGANFVTNAVTFDMRCITGQCIPTNQSAPALPKHFPAQPMSPWVKVAIGMIVSIALLGVWAVAGIRRQRRPLGSSSPAGTAMRRGTGVSWAHCVSKGQPTVVFVDVGYSIDLQNAGSGSDAVSPTPGTRRVLQSVSGLVRPGEMCAVMGPSGAGKSSLLDILAGQNKSGQVDGRTCLVYPDGTTVEDAACWRRICRYVMQDDRILSTDTVEEALMFAACMTLPNSVSKTEILSDLDRVVQQLGLERVRGSRVGSSDQGGLSGGERRRLAVGLELITRPAVLLADEPTSGLDSVSADIVMRTLSAAAKHGCAIIVTIHQPSSQVFSLFDSVCLLAEGGSQAFFGPVSAAVETSKSRQSEPDSGAAEDSIEVSGNGLQAAPMARMQLNPAEGLLEYLVSASDQAVELFLASEEKSMLDSAIAQALDSPGSTSAARPGSLLIQANGESVALPSESAAKADPGQGNVQVGAHTLPGGYAQFELLCRRGMRQVLRDPTLMFLQLIVTLVVGVLTGSTFYKPGLDLTGVHNRTGLLFFIVIYFSLISMSSIGAIVQDKETFMRERAAGLYTTEPFFAAKVLCDLLPLRILPPVAFALIVYPMCALHEGRIGVFIGALLLLNTTAAAMCFCAAAFSRNVGTANLWASIFFIYNMCFGGLLLTSHSTIVNIFMQLSFFFHAYEVLMVSSSALKIAQFRVKGR